MPRRGLDRFGKMWVSSASVGMLPRVMRPELVDVRCSLFGNSTVMGVWVRLTVVSRGA